MLHTIAGEGLVKDLKFWYQKVMHEPTRSTILYLVFLWSLISAGDLKFWLQKQKVVCKYTLLAILCSVVFFLFFFFGGHLS